MPPGLRFRLIVDDVAGLVRRVRAVADRSRDLVSGDRHIEVGGDVLEKGGRGEGVPGDGEGGRDGARARTHGMHLGGVGVDEALGSVGQLLGGAVAHRRDRCEQHARRGIARHRVVEPEDDGRAVGGEHGVRDRTDADLGQAAVRGDHARDAVVRQAVAVRVRSEKDLVDEAREGEPPDRGGRAGDERRTDGDARVDGVEVPARGGRGEAPLEVSRGLSGGGDGRIGLPLGGGDAGVEGVVGRPGIEVERRDAAPLADGGVRLGRGLRIGRVAGRLGPGRVARDEAQGASGGVEEGIERIVLRSAVGELPRREVGVVEDHGHDVLARAEVRVADQGLPGAVAEGGDVPILAVVERAEIGPVAVHGARRRLRRGREGASEESQPGGEGRPERLVSHTIHLDISLITCDRRTPGTRVPGCPSGAEG